MLGSIDLEASRTVDLLVNEINTIEPLEMFGEVVSMRGQTLNVRISSKNVTVGLRCKIITKNKQRVYGEVTAFDTRTATVMAFQPLLDIYPGAKVIFLPTHAYIYPDLSWVGRVINGLGEPIDGKSNLYRGKTGLNIHGTPPPAHQRGKITQRIDVGVRCINAFLTCCQGQRMGIFSGSGVGKSTLLSMLVRFTECDVCVIGLIGERGREVKEFIEDTLGEKGLQKSIMVVATGDEPPLMRREAAFMTLTIAEYFRNQGMSVLCVMDSVTRFAMAMREIGLSNGEPPTTKGYTPSVFSELPRLLERAGPGIEENGKRGDITAFFTVLVDGDDHNEPISDAVRGILDGHIVLDRSIAARGQFPSVNILQSVSRTVHHSQTPEEQIIAKQARKALNLYEDMIDMVRIGAYREGQDPEVDRALAINHSLVDFLSQEPLEYTNLENSFAQLNAILNPEES